MGKVIVICSATLATVFLNAVLFVMSIRLGFGIEPISMSWVIYLNIASAAAYLLLTFFVSALLEEEEKKDAPRKKEII